MEKKFEVRNPDLALSPYTGMTKRHYIKLVKYLLERAFTLLGHSNTWILTER